MRKDQKFIDFVQIPRLYSELNNLFKNARMGSDVKLLMNIAMKQKVINNEFTDDEYDLFNRYWIDINDVQTLNCIKQDAAFNIAQKTLNKIQQEYIYEVEDTKRLTNEQARY